MLVVLLLSSQKAGKVSCASGEELPAGVYVEAVSELQNKLLKRNLPGPNDAFGPFCH